MSLIGFHRFLIATAIVFCLGFGLWEFNAVGREGGAVAFVLGTVFTLLGIGMAVYLRHLARFLGYEEGSEPR
jgi:hypothetical protein